MRFRLKITLCMLCLLSLLFGLGGSAMISISFQGALTRENEAAHERYQMLLNTLRVVNAIETWTGPDDISNILSQLLSQNAALWSALRISTETLAVYESGVSAQLADMRHGDIGPEYCLISDVSAADGRQYLQLSGAFALGEEPLYLDALQDVTAVYAMRAQQEESYRTIYLCMTLACALLTYTISWLLTRPLTKLSRASKEIASGKLYYRSAVNSGDEIGALSADFDFMAARMEKIIWELKSAMERQERFTRSFTHELKSPMASIIGHADLLRTQTLTPEEQAEAANFIFTEAKRLENLSIRLLDVFVMEKSEPQLRKASLEALIERLAASLRPRLAEASIELTVSCESGECYFEPDLLWSLLGNLIDNAAQALPHGGQISVRGELTQDGCRIQVSDTGSGIPPEAMAHITEAFYRADKNRGRKQGGAGLGLALCAKIVELHKGTMNFESKLDEGTTVTVELKGGRA